MLTPDRRGIINRLVETLGELGVRHLEISQTVVHGAFTIALVLALPPGDDAEAVRDALLDALEPGASASILALARAPDAPAHPDPSASPFPSAAPAAGTAPPAADRYLLTAIGHGVPRVVRDITRIVLEHEGNFTDFSTQVADGRLQLLAEVELPPGVGPGALQEALGRASEGPGLAVRLQHQRLFSATNEIAFRRNLRRSVP